LNSSGTVIGLFPDRIYEQVNLQLLPDDLLVLYTDGVVEARNGKEEEFGEETLQDFVLKHQSDPAKTFISELLRKIAAFVGDAPQHDDLTVVALKIL
jgi:Serine phosphatase RsbU, regulator of sigma subunit